MDPGAGAQSAGPLGLWASAPLLSGLPGGALQHGSIIAMWSGGMGESLFESTPRTWMPAGRERFATALSAASAWATERGVTLALRPHARHVLSDVPSVLALLGVQKGGAVHGPPPGIGVLLDPFAMLAAMLLPAVEEHLERVLSVAAGMPGIVGVVVANVRRPPGDAPATRPDHDEGPPLERVPLHAGEIDVRLIVDSVRRHVPVRVPIVLEGGEAPDVRAALTSLLGHPERRDA